MAEVVEFRGLFEIEVAELQVYFDGQLEALRTRIKERQSQELEQRVRELEEMFRAKAERAQERFQLDMDEASRIEQPSLREVREQALLQSLLIYLEAQKRMIQTYIDLWG